MKDEIHEFGSCPLRSQRDYGERTAGLKPLFSETADYILHLMESFRYGCCYNDGSFTINMALIDEKDGRDIHIQSPLEFWKRKAGMCHDASVFVDAMLIKEEISHKCFYLASDRPPHYPTHSFIVAQCTDGSKRIIDVFSTSKCYYDEKFDSFMEAAEWRYHKWMDSDNGGKEALVLQGERMPSPKCGFAEFGTSIIKSFEEIIFN